MKPQEPWSVGETRSGEKCKPMKEYFYKRKWMNTIHLAKQDINQRVSRRLQTCMTRQAQRITVRECNVALGAQSLSHGEGENRSGNVET